MKDKLDIPPLPETAKPADQNANMVLIQSWAETVRKKLSEEEAQILVLIGA